MRTGYMREFSKEEAAMSDTKRMAAVTNRMRQEVQADALSIGHEYQRAAERGFEPAGRSLTEANRAIQAIATEMTDFSKRRFEDVWHAWEQLLSARSFGDVVEVQARFAQKRATPTRQKCPNSERCISIPFVMPLSLWRRFLEG
jgi:hypothetical protein